VAATGLGTEVSGRWRGSASGIINTAAQLGTALGTAVLLLIASLTSGLPGPGHPPPRLAWGIGAALAAAGALRFALARASQDSASQDGASQDGASQDGASQDGASQAVKTPRPG
jgi:MFS family permease